MEDDNYNCWRQAPRTYLGGLHGQAVRRQALLAAELAECQVDWVHLTFARDSTPLFQADAKFLRLLVDICGEHWFFADVPDRVSRGQKAGLKNLEVVWGYTVLGAIRSAAAPTQTSRMPSVILHSARLVELAKVNGAARALLTELEAGVGA